MSKVQKKEQYFHAEVPFDWLRTLPSSQREKKNHIGTYRIVPFSFVLGSFRRIVCYRDLFPQESHNIACEPEVVIRRQSFISHEFTF